MRPRAAGALAALVLLVQATSAGAQEGRGEVRGEVRTADSAPSTPLPYAMVQLLDASGARAVLADSLGRYVFRDVTAGLRRIRALYVGHEDGEVEVLVPEGGAVDVDLELGARAVEIAALTVRTDPLTLAAPDDFEPRSSPPPWAMGEVALRALAEGTGMAESGLGRAAGEAGSGGEPSDPRDVLLMRGSTTDLKLVLLDGAPVYTPFHLGGLLPSFDPSTMGGAALHVGGAPARYDGGLSYVLDLRTRRPRRDRLRGGGALDLMSAQGSVEGPLGPRAGLLLAGRALHDGAAAVWGGGGSPYGYADGLLRFDAEPAPGHRLGMTAFANQESVFLDMAAALGVAGPDAARWGNETLSIVYEGGTRDTGVNLTAAASRYHAELPLPASAEATAGGRPGPIVASGRTDRLRLAADASRGAGEGVLLFGGAVDRLGVGYAAHALRDAHPPAGDATTAASVAGAYLDWSTPASRSLDVRAGLRADYFSSDGHLRWAPRLSLLWSLSDAALLTLAAGRYHQYTRVSDARVATAVADVADGLGAGGAAAPPELLPVATADHLVLSLDQRLVTDVRLGIQGFLKEFRGVTGAEDERLTSSGIDLRVLRAGERLTGWLGYSLAWFWADDRQAGATTTEFTGRHLLSAGLAGSVAGPLGLDLRLAFSDGLPYTSIQLDGQGALASRDRVETGELEDGVPALAGGPGDGFLRVDAELHADLLPVWGGRRFSLRPYVKVLNALDRRDALFWYFAPWRDPEVTPLAELSFLPVIGLEWRF